MAVKVVMLALLLIAFIYLVYRATDYYFSKKEREDKLEAKMKVYRAARDAGIWADDDPDSFDEEEYERAKEELGLEVDF